DERIDGHGDRAVGRRQLAQSHLGRGLLRNVRHPRGRGRDGPGRIDGGASGQSERRCDGKHRAEHQLTSMNVGTSIPGSAPVASSTLVTVTASGVATQGFCWPPKLTFPFSCGFSPKIASVICEESAGSSRDCSWRAHRSAWLLPVAVLALGSL